jgi:hypothetical protein
MTINSVPLVTDLVTFNFSLPVLPTHGYTPIRSDDTPALCKRTLCETVIRRTMQLPIQMVLGERGGRYPAIEDDYCWPRGNHRVQDTISEVLTRLKHQAPSHVSFSDGKHGGQRRRAPMPDCQ